MERTENQVEEFTVVVIGVKPVVDCGLREEGWRQREKGRRDEREDERMVREYMNSKTYLVFGINVSELKFLVQNQESRI